MFERNWTYGHRNHSTPVQVEHRQDPKLYRPEEQRDLIKELGQLQITPGGFGF
jgi:hypothetical protein